MVWQPRTKYNVSKTEPRKVQKSACLAIIGAMKMTPTAAMKILLGLSGHHVMTEGEAQTEVYRIMCTPQWQPKYTTNISHTKKSQHVEHEGCYKDMHTASHYQSSSMTSMYSKTGSSQTKTRHGLVNGQVQDQ